MLLSCFLPILILEKNQYLRCVRNLVIIWGHFSKINPKSCNCDHNSHVTPISPNFPFPSPSHSVSLFLDIFLWPNFLFFNHCRHEHNHHHIMHQVLTATPKLITPPPATFYVKGRQIPIMTSPISAPTSVPCKKSNLRPPKLLSIKPSQHFAQHCREMAKLLGPTELRLSSLIRFILNTITGSSQLPPHLEDPTILDLHLRLLLEPGHIGLEDVGGQGLLSQCGSTTTFKGV